MVTKLQLFVFQIATIGLASDENPFGVVLGGIMYGLYPLFSFRGSISFLAKLNLFLLLHYFGLADKHCAPQRQ